MRERATLFSCASLLLALACAKPEETPPPAAPPGPPADVQAVASDFAFQLPDTLTAGPTTFTLVNNGAELHHLQILKLEEGKTVADLAALPGESPLPTWVVEVGGPNPAGPGGGTAKGTLDLAAGNYVAICFIPSPAPDNRPHMAKGMVRPFTVVPATATRTMPDAHFTVTLNDYSFTFSAPVPAGEHAIKVVNAGPQAHEIVIIKLDAGKKAEDMLAWFGAGMKGPPPGQAVGGAAGISPNGENIIHVNLTPGDYGLYCFVPDAKDGKMHIEHGMVSQFTVE
jgi:hypothetical protein